MADKTHEFLDDIREMRKLFVKEIEGKRIEFDELSFRFWVEAQSQARHEDGLTINRQIFELNKQITKNNIEISKNIEKFANAVEKFANVIEKKIK